MTLRTDREYFEITDGGGLVLAAYCDEGEARVIVADGARGLTYAEARALALHLLDWGREDADELRGLRRAHSRVLDELDAALAGAGGACPGPRSGGGGTVDLPRFPAGVVRAAPDTCAVASAQAFFRERVKVAPGRLVENADLYAAYRRWALERGEPPLGETPFRQEVASRLHCARDVTVIIEGRRARCWSGIALHTPAVASPARFLADCTRVAPGAAARHGDLRAAYEAWAARRGEAPCEPGDFHWHVATHEPGAVESMTIAGVLWWRGLSLVGGVRVAA